MRYDKIWVVGDKTWVSKKNFITILIFLNAEYSIELPVSKKEQRY